MSFIKEYGIMGLMSLLMLGVLSSLGARIFSNSIALATVKEEIKSDRASIKVISLRMKSMSTDIKWIRNHMRTK